MKYLIMGKYRGQIEEIDEAKTRKEAQYLLSEYRLAFGLGWQLWIKPSKRSEEE
jgi:hypothetical protein